MPTQALSNFLNIIEESNTPLITSETKLLDFLFDNCPNLDSKVVHHFLKQVRSEIEVK